MRFELFCHVGRRSWLLLLVGAALTALALAQTVELIRSKPAESAARAVFATYPQFAGIMPYQSGIVGDPDYWTAERKGDSWRVTVRKGFGDCHAGCMGEQFWLFEVDGAAVRFISGPSAQPPSSGT